jgi:hypothetical protein
VFKAKLGGEAVFDASKASNRRMDGVPVDGGKDNIAPRIPIQQVLFHLGVRGCVKQSFAYFPSEAFATDVHVSVAIWIRRDLEFEGAHL